MAGHSVSLPPCPVGYCSDASLFGFALHTSQLSSDEVNQCCRYRERWRFCRHEVDAADTSGEHDFHPGFSAGCDPVDTAYTRYLWSHLPRAPNKQGAVNRLLVETELTGEEAGIEALPDDLLDRRRWHRVLVGSWRRMENIQELEARTALLGLRHSCR
eukprot:5367568-Amphidinium_carterae.1